MISVTVSLPPNTPPEFVDALSVRVLDDTHDRQPRHTYLEGVNRTDPEVLELTFRT